MRIRNERMGEERTRQREGGDKQGQHVNQPNEEGSQAGLHAGLSGSSCNLTSALIV
jgi:hypothetical protein